MSENRTKRTVYFHMVLLPSKGWTRVGRAYSSMEAARGLNRFVSQAWHGLRTKVAQCTLRWVNGKMVEASRKVLSEKFNFDPPLEQPRAGEEASRG
jgi:hypothetical protein